MVAHAAMTNGAPSAIRNFAGERLMQKKTDYQAAGTTALLDSFHR
jgi:hypothetical protein